MPRRRAGYVGGAYRLRRLANWAMVPVAFDRWPGQRTGCWHGADRGIVSSSPRSIVAQNDHVFLGHRSPRVADDIAGTVRERHMLVGNIAGQIFNQRIAAGG